MVLGLVQVGKQEIVLGLVAVGKLNTVLNLLQLGKQGMVLGLQCERGSIGHGSGFGADG